METTAIIELVGALGTFAVVVALLAHVFRTLLPKRDKDFLDALIRLEASRSKDSSAVVEALDRLSARVAKQHALLQVHDATSKERRTGHG